jgi:hypothetical protein
MAVGLGAMGFDLAEEKRGCWKQVGSMRLVVRGWFARGLPKSSF